MKIYKFFKIPDENEKDDIDIERKYILYAITNNKEIAKRFKKDRNMEKFIYKTHSGITKEEYADMCNENRSSVLEYHKLRTVFDDYHTKSNSKEVTVLMTNWEYQLVEDVDTIMANDIWRNLPYPLIFNKKYLNALNTLEYINMYKIINIDILPFEIIEKIDEYFNNDDYSAPNIIYDELSVFIRIIKDTL